MQSNAVISPTSPALKLNVQSSVRILPGGKITGNWIDVSTNSLSVDGSGEFSAAGLGHLNGPGSGEGKYLIAESQNCPKMPRELIEIFTSFTHFN